MERKLRKKIKELAKTHSLPESVVQKAFESQFKMTREIIRNLELLNISEEEFKDLKTNFNWKYIGKYNTSYNFIQKIKKKWENKKK